MRIYGNDELRFWSKVQRGDPKDCWNWIGPKTSRGYGQFKVDGKNVLAHRYAYYLVHQYLPKNKEYICHHCDNPACVNPFHLFLGTQTDNMRDMISKGRGANVAGSNNPRATITDRVVTEIRDMWDKGVSTNQISELLNVSMHTIHNILSGRTWTHLPMSSKLPSNRGSRLCEKDVLEMRRLSSFGLTDTFIGKMFRLSQPQANKIINNKSWVTDGSHE